MKNFRLLSVVASLMMMTATIAQTTNSIFGSDAFVTQGMTGDLIINYEFDKANTYSAFEFSITLPKGISISTKNSDIILGNCINGYNVKVSQSSVDPQRYKVTGYTDEEGQTISGQSGSLLTLLLKADPSLAVGAELESGNIVNSYLSTTTSQSVDVESSSFNISIVNYITLKETSTEAPVPTDQSVDVRVVRTINANEWSTICLPFAMDAVQVKAAFGDDVKLGDFTGCDVTYDDVDDEKVVSIKVNFEGKEEIVANYPYIIKVSSPVTSFNVDDVTIHETTDLTVKKNQSGRFYNKFIGTHAAMTVPEDCLFLNGNKFWYSTGKTNMKAFRAYFDFYEIVDNANTNISFGFDEADGINNVTVGQPAEGIYDIQGRKVHTDENKWDNLKKGVYIINGKKVVK